MFLIDCEFAIFYRCPPRLTLSELNADLPFQEAAFATTDMTEWSLILRREQTSEDCSVAALVQKITSDDQTYNDGKEMCKLSVFALFYVLCGIQSLGFHLVDD